MSHWSYANAHTQEIIEAYQFHADAGNHTQAYPRWLLDLLLDNKIESKDDGKTWFYDRTTQIPDGDWVVWDGMKIIVVPQNEFDVLYNRMP